MCRRLHCIAIMLLFSTSGNVSAAGREVITVKGSTVQDNVILIDVDIRGQMFQLECFKSNSTCYIPPRGLYSMEKLPSGTGSYMDCVNVELYAHSSNSKKEDKIGEYCLLD